MKEFLEIICTSSLFSDIAETEVSDMLSCLEAREKDFKKETYIFRAGDTTGSLGIVLSGCVLVIQEDFWGNRNIVSFFTQGQTFAEAFACAPEAVLNVSVIAQTPCRILFLNVKKVLQTCSASCSHHNKMIQNLLSALAVKNLRQNEKLAHLGQRTTRAKLLNWEKCAKRDCWTLIKIISFCCNNLIKILQPAFGRALLNINNMKPGCIILAHTG